MTRKLERFGDLATNVAERIIYLVTGAHVDLNEPLTSARSAPLAS